ncbi:MAG: hydroxymethylbilane synthase [Clostridia bacterium]|nr:hydroxymethylbilane synthase [Clostridia bacterium]
MKAVVRVGSRESKLAVIQSMTLVDALKQQYPQMQVSLLTMKTTGDRILDRTLEQVGGKGLFVKELERALRDRLADLTVHSLKDVPMELPEDLPLVGFSVREDPRDALVLPKGQTELVPELPIGTSSRRRAEQLKLIYPSYEVKSVRGNLQTRLRKLDNGEYGALILAAAGLKRLGLEHRISRYFTVDEMIPAACQGILGIQGRSGEDYSYLSHFNSKDSEKVALCERAFVRELDGGCTSPICAYAEIIKDKLLLRGLYYDENSGMCRKGTLTGSTNDPCGIGIALANELRGQRGDQV